MAANVLVDTSFLVAVINRRDPNHTWASALLKRWSPPWRTCDAVLSETFHMIGSPGMPLLVSLIRDGALTAAGVSDHGRDEVLTLMEKYADVPILNDF